MIDKELMLKLKELAVLHKELGELIDEYDEVKLRIQNQTDVIVDKYEQKFEDELYKRSEKITDTKDKCTQLPKKTPELKSNMGSTAVSRLGAIMGLVFYVSLICFVISFIGILPIPFGLTFLIVAGMFVGGFIWMFKNGAISNYFTWQKELEEWRVQTDADMMPKDKLLEAYRNFDREFEKTYTDLDETRLKLNITLFNESQEVNKPAEQRRDEILDRVGEINAIMDGNDAIHIDNMPYIQRIVKILETGRADDLKEAIGIAIDDARRDAEEAQRRAEAIDQKRILEEQAEENRRHNREMMRAEEERVKAEREHAKIMETQARIQAEETKRLRQEMEKQNRK